MISAQPNRDAQERLITKAMQTPNQHVRAEDIFKPLNGVNYLRFLNYFSSLN